MELIIRKEVFGSRPKVKMPDQGFFELMHEAGIRKMVEDHYDLLVQSEIKHLFPENETELRVAKEHASDFFVQICGGPSYYKNNRGEPMMTRRHEPFEITSSARQVWLDCYRTVLLKLEISEDLILSFWNYINDFSLWMVNTPESNDFNTAQIDL